MIISVGDIVEFEHLKNYPKYHGVVIEISGEYCYVCVFDKSMNFNSSIPYHHTGLTILSSANDTSQ